MRRCPLVVRIRVYSAQPCRTQSWRHDITTTSHAAMFRRCQAAGHARAHVHQLNVHGLPGNRRRDNRCMLDHTCWQINHRTIERVVGFEPATRVGISVNWLIQPSHSFSCSGADDGQCRTKTATWRTPEGHSTMLLIDPRRRPQSMQGIDCKDDNIVTSQSWRHRDCFIVDPTIASRRTSSLTVLMWRHIRPPTWPRYYRHDKTWNRFKHHHHPQQQQQQLMRSADMRCI